MIDVLLTGLLAIVVQVVLLRELSAAFYGVDLIYLLALGAWLLWTAAGALVGRASLRPSAARVAGLLIAIGTVIPLEVVLIRALRRLLGGVPGAYLPLPAQIAASTLSLLPASLLLGLLFQWTAKRYLAGGPTSDVGGPTSDGRRPMSDAGGPRRSLARAYAIESVGGMVGGILTTWTLHLGLQNLQLAFAAAMVAFAASCRADSGGRTIRAIAFVCLLASTAAGWQAARLDTWSTSWNHPDVVAVEDTPYGRVTITRRAGQVAAYENDALVLESEGTEPEDFAHLSMLQHPAPRRVLLVSGAAAGLLPAVEQHGVERIDDIDPNRALVRLLDRHLHDSFSQSLARPAVRVVFDDPRRAIAACNDCDDGYDVIVIAAPEPASAQGNRFFTREFFALCATRLRSGGILSLRLSSLENLWTTPLVVRTGSIYAALREVFRDVVVLPGATNVVLASQAPLMRDPEVLGDRLVRRGIHARLVSARYLRYLYLNDRYAEVQALLRNNVPPRVRIRPNTDANAASYQATALVWLSKFVPSLGRADLAWIADAFGWSRLRTWLLLVGIAAAALTWRLAGWPRRSVAVAAAACGSMMLESLLLLHYQLKHGVVFQDLGLLLMTVMAGLATGAWMVDRMRNLAKANRLPRLFFATTALLALGVSALVRSGVDSGFALVALLLFVTGACVAGVFACASLQGHADERRLVSPLYAADVLGGALGSIGASLLLIPLLGLPLTAEWTAALMAVALVLA